MNTQPKVLIAEDNTVSRAILTKLIKSLGFDVTAAENGEQAIQLQKQFDPDLILVDVEMPVMNGYETCEVLRTQCADHIPILFLSGRNRKEDIIKGYDSGGNDFIIKPFNHEELLQKIKLAVVGKRKVDELRDQQKSSLNIATLSEAAKLKRISAFIKQSLMCESFDTLIELLFNTLTCGLGLKATIQIRLDSFSYIHSDDGIDRPLDLQIIKSCQTDGKVFHFKANTALFSHRDFSLLVRNIDKEQSNVALVLDAFETALDRIDQLTHQTLPTPGTDITDITLKVELAFDQITDQMNNFFSDPTASSSICEADENRLLEIIHNGKRHLIAQLKKP